jgi:hypothetical protein
MAFDQAKKDYDYFYFFNWILKAGIYYLSFLFASL